MAEDGTCMFEVTAGKNGRSLEVRAIENCKGKIYHARLVIEPNVANSITLRVPEWEPNSDD